jgi:hypothetical protein
VLSPSIEYPIARTMRSMPVRPLKGLVMAGDCAGPV